MGSRAKPEILRDFLFDTDATKWKDTQKTFCKHIDNVISATYGQDLSITHRCIDRDENEQLKIGIADNLFREKDPTHFHCARHKELYDEVKGGIMYFPDCKQTMSTIDIVNKALQRWTDCLIPGDRAQHNRSDTMIPLSKKIGYGCIHFLLPPEWRLYIRNRSVLGKYWCSGNIAQVQIWRTLIQS